MLFIIKSAILLMLLYSCFFIFLSKETFHRFNRIMLLGIMLASVVIPVFRITTEHPTFINEEFQHLQTFINETPYAVAPSYDVYEKDEGTTWVQALVWTYMAGAAVMFIITIVQVVSLMRFMRGGLRHTDTHGNTVILLKGDFPPFSIFRYIVMSVNDYEYSRKYILAHEQEHIRLGHSYDLMLLEVMKIFQWFNPFIWFISRDLKTIHEYEADQAVINQGIDAKSYQQLLVMKVVGNRLQPFTNNLNHGSLKKRIIMMYKKNSNRWLMLKSLCAIPVVALAMNAFATPNSVMSVEEIVAQLDNKEIAAFSESAKDKDDDFAIFPVVDKYGRITGFSHEGEPAEHMKNFVCTYEYIFINGRQATKEEVRNYKNLNIRTFYMGHNPAGTAKYGYKDKKGIIDITTYPIIVVDGVVSDNNFSNTDVMIMDEIAKALQIPTESIKKIKLVKSDDAKKAYGPRGINGAIEITTK